MYQTRNTWLAVCRASDGATTRVEIEAWDGGDRG